MQKQMNDYIESFLPKISYGFEKVVLLSLREYSYQDDGNDV